jgi:toxin YoeB
MEKGCKRPPNAARRLRDQACGSRQAEKARDCLARESRLKAEMRIAWTEDAWQDYLHWQQSDEKILASINALIKDIKRASFKGVGKPGPLKHALQGWWLCRISGEHRLVYRLSGKSGEQQCDVVQCRYHY